MPEDVDFATTREGETDSEEDFAGQSAKVHVNTNYYYLRSSCL